MEISVIVTPNARIPMVIKGEDGSYKAKVNARASEGKANMRLIEMLAKHFGVPKSHVRILKGLGSRNKLVEISDS